MIYKGLQNIDAVMDITVGGKRFTAYLSAANNCADLVNPKTGLTYFRMKPINNHEKGYIHNEMKKAIRHLLSLDKDQEKFDKVGLIRIDPPAKLYPPGEDPIEDVKMPPWKQGWKKN